MRAQVTKIDGEIEQSGSEAEIIARVDASVTGSLEKLKIKQLDVLCPSPPPPPPLLPRMPSSCDPCFPLFPSTATAILAATAIPTTDLLCASTPLPPPPGNMRGKRRADWSAELVCRSQNIAVRGIVISFCRPSPRHHVTPSPRHLVSPSPRLPVSPCLFLQAFTRGACMAPAVRSAPRAGNGCSTTGQTATWRGSLDWGLMWTVGGGGWLGGWVRVWWVVGGGAVVLTWA